MSEKINFKLFKPFGSTVAKAVMPLELMKDFQNDLKQITFFENPFEACNNHLSF